MASKQCINNLRTYSESALCSEVYLQRVALIYYVYSYKYVHENGIKNTLQGVFFLIAITLFLWIKSKEDAKKWNGKGKQQNIAECVR